MKRRSTPRLRLAEEGPVFRGGADGFRRAGHGERSPGQGGGGTRARTPERGGAFPLVYITYPRPCLEDRRPPRVTRSHTCRTSDPPGSLTSTGRVLRAEAAGAANASRRSPSSSGSERTWLQVAHRLDLGGGPSHRRADDATTPLSRCSPRSVVEHPPTGTSGLLPQLKGAPSRSARPSGSPVRPRVPCSAITSRHPHRRRHPEASRLTAP